jgi:hypothetical protein
MAVLHEQQCSVSPGLPLRKAKERALNTLARENNMQDLQPGNIRNEVLMAQLAALPHNFDLMY